MPYDRWSPYANLGVVQSLDRAMVAELALSMRTAEEYVTTESTASTEIPTSQQFRPAAYVIREVGGSVADSMRSPDVPAASSTEYPPPPPPGTWIHIPAGMDLPPGFRPQPHTGRVGAAWITPGSILLLIGGVLVFAGAMTWVAIVTAALNIFSQVQAEEELAYALFGVGFLACAIGWFIHQWYAYRWIVGRR